MTKKQRVLDLENKVRELEARIATLESYRVIYPWWSIIPPEPIIWTSGGTGSPDLGKSWCESIVPVSGECASSNSCPY